MELSRSKLYFKLHLAEYVDMSRIDPKPMWENVWGRSGPRTMQPKVGDLSSNTAHKGYRIFALEINKKDLIYFKLSRAHDLHRKNQKSVYQQAPEQKITCTPHAPNCSKSKSSTTISPPLHRQASLKNSPESTTLTSETSLCMG